MKERLMRIARVNEFDNGRVLFSYERLTELEAEEKARKKSLEFPDEIFYVKFDDVMNPCTDVRWRNGKSYHYSEI